MYLGRRASGKSKYKIWGTHGLNQRDDRTSASVLGSKFTEVAIGITMKSKAYSKKRGFDDLEYLENTSENHFDERWCFMGPNLESGVLKSSQNDDRSLENVAKSHTAERLSE